MKFLLSIIFGLVLAFSAGAGVVWAALGFGRGVYVNLCGSGTAATAYTCDAGCSPATGRCEGSNNGVVKWTCSGRWIQCLEAESEWTNSQEFGSVACGKTVQISKFDKKCRLDDGTWDSACNLLGYMVWYSGDCGTNEGAAPTPTATPTPTGRVNPTQTTTATPTPTSASKFASPTATPQGRTSSPTPTAVPICNKVCKEANDCGAGFACEAGVCRNPACPSDKSCFCGQVAGASGGGATPETGAADWILVAGLLLAVAGGWMMRRTAAKIW